MTELPKAYEPADVEPRWYEFWQSEGVFRASVDPDDQRPAYVIALPPPNVTGSLHMGHALMGTLEDVLIRHQRMLGKNTLWQPGIDHAGIATQTVVERQLRRENLSRHDLGREKFVERIWAVERAEWRSHRRADARARLLCRLGANQVHHGPGAEPGGEREPSSACMKMGSSIARRA
jgi:valyl-tRNA synthetase